MNFQEYAGSQAYTPANANFSTSSGKQIYVAPPKFSSGGGSKGNFTSQFHTPSRVQNVRNVFSFMAHPFEFSGASQGKKIYYGTLPIGATGGAVETAKGVGSLFTKGVAFAKRSLSPAEVVSRAKYVPLLVAGAEGTYYASKGKFFNPFKAKSLAGEAGYIVGGVPSALLGAGIAGSETAGGFGKYTSKLASDIFGKGKELFSRDTRVNLPSLPTSINPPSFAGGTQNLAPTFNFTTPSNVDLGSVPSISGPSFNPSVQVGGGGGGMELALIALLLGGGAGYLLGHRKKKKSKRYKKRRKH
jgi:hypothetical protein